ncbi:MAG: DegV family protein [Clostridiales bacterium]|nr:MAG: DegV family protein [Clostridiales bacterium]
MGVKIITDSACDLNRKIIEDYGIEVMPLLVNDDDSERLDGVSIGPKELFEGMRSGRVYKTAQIPLAELMKVFESHRDRECVYLSFSSKLSGTCDSARLVAENLKDKYPGLEKRIRIVDTKCASGGMGLVVLKAAQMAEEGCSLDEIVDAANFYSGHMQHIFTVDNLEYLFRGGRVSKAQAFVGGLLNVKPILDVQDGSLIPIEKARGKKHLHKRMIELIEERGTSLENQVIGINHGDDLESAEKILDLIGEKFDCAGIVVDFIGCAIGAHSGPGTLALFFLDEEPPMGHIAPISQRSHKRI